MQLNTSQEAGKQLPYNWNDFSRPIEICIVGAGPVGMHLMRQLCQSRLSINITMFSAEKHRPYNRTLLSSYLAQRKDREELLANVWDEEIVSMHTSCKVNSIDKDNQTITTEKGKRHQYDLLILATGSKVVLPKLPNLNLPGVFSLRNLDDIDRLLKHKGGKENIVILGGGLLGVETALAIKTPNNNVTVLDRQAYIMNRQINSEAGGRVVDYLRQQGLEVILNTGLSEVRGKKSVESLLLKNGNVIPCDSFIIATGACPNIDLALGAGLEINRGVVVDEQLRTSDENIFAIGECTEYQGHTFGIVGPGIKQASVLAKLLLGGSDSYKPSANNTKLKVSHLPIHSIGDIKLNDQKHTIHYTSEDGLCYRALIVEKNYVVGFIAVGDVSNLAEFQRVITQKEKLNFFTKRRFKRNGFLKHEQGSISLSALSDDHPVCQCTSTSIGVIRQALCAGCDSVKGVQDTTGAGTVCGNCVPILEKLVSGDETAPKIKVEKILLSFSIFALISFLAFVYLPGVAATVSVTAGKTIDYLLTSAVYKQITGYSILGMSILTMLMSVKKRWLKTLVGQYKTWRLLHTSISILCLAALILHTGFYMGVNLNRLLMINFLLILCVGSLSGVVVGFAAANKPFFVKLREYVIWAHILVLWPLLPLLLTHILTVYYF